MSVTTITILVLATIYLTIGTIRAIKEPREKPWMILIQLFWIDILVDIAANFINEIREHLDNEDVTKL